jgi:TRAP-type C4-dicarboxylate transport system permease small subunit
MMIAKILNLINNLLTFNFFFVLLSFAWFIIAIIGKYTNVPLGMQVWQSLWEPLFLPAISVLMGGAILSGTISYVAKDRSQSFR